MTEEEAKQRHLTLSPTKHSMKRRHRGHDYYAKGLYMLTMVTDGRKPLFGQLRYADMAYVELSPLGRLIKEREVAKINRFYPMVEVWRLCIMPDHIHMIVRVKESMPQGKHLGFVVSGFKLGCTRAWRQLMQGPTTVQGPPTVQGPEALATITGGASLPRLFEEGYNDKVLYHPSQLERWKHYLDDNPRRLWLKRQNPDMFVVKRDFDISGHKCQIVGNQFLLDIPDKMAVIVHRRYSESEYEELRREWLACGERGGVLVSAAIAPKEKAVLREAMDNGCSVILLRENGFPDMYKPTGESFDRCLDGQLLQVSLWEFHTESKTITREQCLTMNKLAEEICCSQETTK